MPTLNANGIFSIVPPAYVVDGIKSLPPARMELPGTTKAIDISTPDGMRIRVHFTRSTYERQKSTHCWWRAVRAEKVG